MQGVGSMQGMVTPTSSTSGAVATSAITGMAGTLDRLADDLTFTLDRKAETEQGRLGFRGFGVLPFDDMSLCARV